MITKDRFPARKNGFRQALESGFKKARENVQKNDRIIDKIANYRQISGNKFQVLWFYKLYSQKFSRISIAAIF